MNEHTPFMSEADLTKNLSIEKLVEFPTRRPKKRDLKNLTKVAGVWYFHKVVRGRREFNGRKTPFSLETRDLFVAKAKRDALLKAASGAELDRVLGRASEELPSLQSVLSAFLEADHPREQTRKKYVRSLRLVIRKATGRAELEDLTATDLTAELVHRYQDAVVRAVRDSDEDDESEAMQQAKYTANRVLVQARSIFANEKPFRRLKLPDLAGFLGADLFQIKRDLSYTPMTPAELALFVGKSAELKERARAGDSASAAVYVAWLCFRWLGMRNSEIEHCRPADWLVQVGDRWIMRITNRPYFLVKAAGSIRDLPLVDWLRLELLEFCGGRQWLAAGDTPTRRHEVTHYAVNEWMRTCYQEAIAAGVLPAGTIVRTAYDWRKQAGSELYAKTKDILQVSKWLGHQSVHTTTRWYVNLINSLPSLA